MYYIGHNTYNGIISRIPSVQLLFSIAVSWLGFLSKKNAAHFRQNTSMYKSATIEMCLHVIVVKFPSLNDVSDILTFGKGYM